MRIKKFFYIGTSIIFSSCIIFSRFGAVKVNTYKFEYSSSGFSVSDELDCSKKTNYSKNKVPKKGIDISSWSGKVDWKRIKESGIEFVMIREGFGISEPNQVDKRFHEYIKSAQEQKIACGVYHYSYALSKEEAVEEAKFCLENIKGYKLEYPVVFDIEDPSMEKCRGRVATDMCKGFCDEIRKNGYYAMVYANKNWIKHYLFEKELLEEYDLWYAQCKQRLNVPNYSCGIWQKDQNKRIEGVSWFVDINESYYDYEKIIKELKLNGF